VNRERAPAEYVVRAALTPGAIASNETGARRFEASGPPEPVAFFPVALEDGAKWEGNLTFAAPAEPGTYRLGLDLERSGREGAYRSLHLWVTVRA